MTFFYVFFVVAATLAARSGWRRGARARGFLLPVFAALALSVGCIVEAPAKGGGGSDAGRITCGSVPHLSGQLVSEPDGSETCLPGACDIGWADCDGNPENGCEADLTMPAHCGVCDFVCGHGDVCNVSEGIGYCHPGSDGGADADASGNPLVPDAG